MDRLYKYTRIEYVAQMLQHGIWASTPYVFNDPYEYAFLSNPNEYRICCLSRSGNAKLMWSHYANGHKECSVQIKLPDYYSDSDSVLRKVDYRSTIPQGIDDFERLYIKDKKWASELEVRAVYTADNADEHHWNVSEHGVCLKARITRVYFGCMTEDNLNYYQALVALKDFNDKQKRKKDKIEVCKYTMHPDRYLFIKDKSYNYENEIQRLRPSFENQETVS